MDKLHQKYETLKEYLKSLESVAVAFSGGVDSTFLLKVAHDVLGESAIAVTEKSASFAAIDLEESKAFCERENIQQFFTSINQLKIPHFAKNPKDRCYFCKKATFADIYKVAKNLGLNAVCEGTNVDDEGDYRPGMRAITELGIKSPLRFARLTKQDIRTLSHELQLPTWSKPSAACLASRVPYGEPITEQKLRLIEQGEKILSALGFVQKRVRIHEGATVHESTSLHENAQNFIARIEVMPSDFEKAIANAEQIEREFKKLGFSYTALDLKGHRTGSLNETL